MPGQISTVWGPRSIILATGCNPGVPPYEIDCIHAMYIGGFPHQLGDLIQKCVQPDPVRRFQSCRELMEALEDASFDVTTNLSLIHISEPTRRS